MARSVIPASAGALAALLLAAPCAADVFTVGPDGDFATLPQAVLAANAAEGFDHEIRLQATTFTDRPFIDHTSGKALTISGGWDVAFDVQSPDPGATVFTLAPGAEGNPIFVMAGDGELDISNITATGGRGVSANGGVMLQAYELGEITLRDCVVRENHTTTPNALIGGGVRAYAEGSGRLWLERCEIRGNVIEAGTSAGGGGVSAGADGDGEVTVSDNLIVGNSASTQPGTTSTYVQLDAAGLLVTAYGASTIHVLRNRVIDNVVEVLLHDITTSKGYGMRLVADQIGTGTGARIVARGNVVRGNVTETTDDFVAHVDLMTGNDAGGIDLGDTEVTRGLGGSHGLIVGLYGSTPSARLHLTNITVADNSGIAIAGNPRFPETILGSVFNSLIGGSVASDVPGWLQQGNNRIELPQGFANPAAGDYTLAATSPAIDAGIATPPGTLGDVDANGGTRVVGAAVDLGAHEYGSRRIHADGFE